MTVFVTSLRWADVDPSLHPLDTNEVKRTVESLLRISSVASGDPQAREDAIDRALLSEFGAKVAGWRWARSEPGGGGPVAAYCCAQHSLSGGVSADTEVVLAAVKDWRLRLVQISEQFELLKARSQGLDIADKASRAASHLLALVLDWTEAEDAWYGTFEVFLSWYLERELDNPERARIIARDTVNGRFESWIAPSTEQQASFVQEVAETTKRALRASPVDALANWQSQRLHIRWEQKRHCRPVDVSRDGHERYVREFDAKRSSERARRMERAIKEARRAARAGQTLTLAGLCRLQEIVLGKSVAFRTTEAFAHGGTERYGMQGDTEAQFISALSDANDEATPVHARAARVYLDVCYFHPFEDGNARAARLALDYVLTSQGLALVAAEPVFAVARRALDSYGPYSLLHIVDYLAGPRVIQSS